MERRVPVPPALLRDLIGDLGGCLKVASVLDDFDAERAHRGVLAGAVTDWYDDGGSDIVLARGIAYCLAVIASCCRDDTCWLLPGAQKLVQVDETAAHLECSRRPVVLVLYPDGRPDSRLEQWPPVLRGGGHRFVDQSSGGFQLFERRKPLGGIPLGGTASWVNEG